MIREAAIKELKRLQGGGDIVAIHGDADKVLCDLLKMLGYGDVVEEYHKVEKWYA